MFYTKKLRGVLSTVLLSCVMVLGLSSTTSINTLAAGVVLTVSPVNQLVATANTVTLGLTTTTAVPVTGIIEVVYPTAGYTGTPTLSVALGVVGATTTTTSGSDTIASAVVNTIIPVGANSITVTGLTTSATANNNLFTVYTSAGDYGAAFQYVGSANQVTVRAVVPITLSFAIRNAADTANTNSCDMGNLSVSAVGSCAYRLKVATNAENGYTINTVTTGNFTNGTNNFVNAALGTSGTPQTAGIELYGARINKGSITGVGGTTILAPVYDAGSSNNVSYVNTSVAALVTADKPNNPASTDLINTTLVTHEASINTSTAAGIYTQKVTYTITPSFSIPASIPQN